MNPLTTNILVVDDEPSNFDVIETFLFEQDYHIHYASSGKYALDCLDALQPDLILLDVMMPELDGIEVCRRLKSTPQWANVPIIMVTALSSKEDLAQCLNAGADDFIGKPVNSFELRARVQSMLRIKRQYDEIKSLSSLQTRTIDLLQNSLQELSGNLASSLPHELNTPLNGIMGAIAILLDEYETMSPEELKEFLLLAKESANRLEGLTRKFLNYVYLELAPHKAPDAKSYNHKLTKSVNCLFILDVAQKQAKKDGRVNDLLCEFNVLDDELDQIVAAVTHHDMQIMISELLENAFKFSKPNTQVKLTSDIVNNKFHLAIADHGLGMTADQISKIGAFVQFERKLHEQQGAGLGLKIVTKIVENYEGNFSISSTYNQGTTINIELPVGN
jgi:DNA-binding response OmpR family regulator/anti-sigma regulatory factor (Ser/Thr protein kinase)